MLRLPWFCNQVERSFVNRIMGNTYSIENEAVYSAYRVKVDCQSIISLNNKTNPYDFEKLVHWLLVRYHMILVNEMVSQEGESIYFKISCTKLNNDLKKLFWWAKTSKSQKVKLIFRKIQLMYSCRTNVLVTVPTNPVIFEVGLV